MAEEAENVNRVLREYTKPGVNGASSAIRCPTIAANNFEIKPAIINGAK